MIVKTNTIITYTYITRSPKIIKVIAKIYPPQEDKELPSEDGIEPHNIQFIL